MTVESHPLGRPSAATMRGGDCHARDLNRGHNVHGEHRFAATTHCQISNGLLRLTARAAGLAPALTVEARRGRAIVGDTYDDVYDDVYGGSIGTPAWLAMGVLTIDSPSVSALLTAVRLVRIKGQGEEITIRLVAPLMADAFVTLKRGERMVHGQHGSTRAPRLDIDRRWRWTATPSLVGTASVRRVEEAATAPGLDAMHRFVGSIDPATTNAGAFSLTASSVVSARFVAGVGTYADRDNSGELHRQGASNGRVAIAV